MNKQENITNSGINVRLQEAPPLTAQTCKQTTVDPDVTRFAASDCAQAGGSLIKTPSTSLEAWEGEEQQPGSQRVCVSGSLRLPPQG